MNHFRHDRKIFIPFYLLSSLKHSLEKHVENLDNPVLHEGLIHLIMNYAKAHEVKPSPVLNTHVSSSKLEVQVVYDTNLEGENSGLIRDWRDQDLFDDPEYCSPTSEGPILTPRTSSRRHNKHSRWVASTYKILGTKLVDFVSPRPKKPKSGKRGGDNIDNEKKIKIEIPINVDLGK